VLYKSTFTFTFTFIHIHQKDAPASYKPLVVISPNLPFLVHMGIKLSSLASEVKRSKVRLTARSITNKFIGNYRNSGNDLCKFLRTC